MTQFVLTVLDNEHVILSTTERLPQDTARQLGDIFQNWKEGEQGKALIIAECEVVDLRKDKETIIELLLDDDDSDLASAIATQAQIRDERIANGECPTCGAFKGGQQECDKSRHCPQCDGDINEVGGHACPGQ